MSRITKISKPRFKKAIKGTMGIITKIAINLKVERLTVYNFINKNQEWCKKLLEQESESVTDMAEHKLFKKINEDDLKAIKFYLSTKGKNRGYVPKQEVEHSGELPLSHVNINIDLGENGDKHKTNPETEESLEDNAS